jgi:site-specific DNA recombinase
MRAAIYARFSSQRQHDRSIEDQVRLCREHAERLSASVAGVYADFALSGAHLGSRPQALQLLEDAKARRFDVVITEGLDRLSRDQEDIAGIFKRLAFAGVRIITVTEGDVSEIVVGLKGTMNALFLKDLAIKVRRGARGRIEAGRSAGGLSYGYDVVREFDAKGELVRGKRAINEAQANVVRRIFRDYVAGKSPRAIAAALNTEGVPAARGRHWNASSINGHPGRGNGILFNPLYRGELVWNRIVMVKDPDSGRRISRANPRDARVVVDVPELRIVPDELWQEAQARKRAFTGIRAERQVRPRHLLSGLLRCACGGSYISTGADRLGCSRYAESGTCSNAGSVRRRHVEERVLEGLRTKLLHPDAVRAALRAYHDERKRLRGDVARRRRDLARRLARLKGEIEQLVDQMCAGTSTPASNARLVALDGAGSERERLEQELAALEGPDRVVDLHPGAIEIYTKAVADLRETLAAGAAHATEAVEMLRGLVDHITIQPAGRGRPPEITLYGRLAELLTSPIRVLGPVRSLEALVAGEGVEPPTLGL